MTGGSDRSPNGIHVLPTWLQRVSRERDALDFAFPRLNEPSHIAQGAVMSSTHAAADAYYDIARLQEVEPGGLRRRRPGLRLCEWRTAGTASPVRCTTQDTTSAGRGGLRYNAQSVADTRPLNPRNRRLVGDESHRRVCHPEGSRQPDRRPLTSDEFRVRPPSESRASRRPQAVPSILLWRHNA